MFQSSESGVEEHANKALVKLHWHLYKRSYQWEYRWRIRKITFSKQSLLFLVNICPDGFVICLQLHSNLCLMTLKHLLSLLGNTNGQIFWFNWSWKVVRTTSTGIHTRFSTLCHMNIIIYMNFIQSDVYWVVIVKPHNLTLYGKSWNFWLKECSFRCFVVLKYKKQMKLILVYSSMCWDS